MARVFVGNLPPDVKERDLSSKFSRFGRIARLHIQLPPRTSPFAFIEFQDDQDAEDAVRDMHGRKFEDCTLRVEIVDDISDKKKGTQYRVRVSNLRPEMTSQELKDFLRTGGDVVHAEVDERGGGAGSFATFDEMRRAVRALNGRTLAGEEVEVVEDRPSAGTGGSYDEPLASPRSRSQSRSLSPRARSRHDSEDRRRGRSRSRSRSKSRSRSRSRSRSPRYRAAQRSRSRSLSRSPRRSR